MAADAPASLSHIGQVSMSVNDIEAAVTFYRDTLGLTHLFTAGQLAFFDCDGTRLMIDALPEAQGRGNSVLYFTVPDINTATQSLRNRGVAFQSEPHLIHRHADGTEEWMAFFRDPAANTLALMARIPPSAP